MRTNKLRSLTMCLLSLALLLHGCGSSHKDGSSPDEVPAVSEALCASCHSSTVSTTTGDNIYNDYMASAHHTVPNAKAHYPDGIGCQGCHGGGSQHNGVGPIPYPDPSASGKCFNCHKNYLPVVHFRNMTASSDAVSSAMYVTKNYENACTACHDPHKADKGITTYHTEWAESGHGDVNGAAWSDEDFKTNTSCIRCHTATGYINYVQSGYVLPTTTWATGDDKGREVLTCRACHTSYDFKNRVRSAAAYTAPYNGNKNPVAYDNMSESNLCIACHTGRESGDSVNGISNFSNVSFKNPHYLPAAAMLFSKSGFRYYSSATKYTSVNSHSQLGTANEPSNAATGSTSGPCVTCHIVVSGKSTHTFDALVVASKTSLNGGCYGCHSGTVAADEEESKAYFARFMDFFQWQLAQRGIYYSETYPYFYSDAAFTKPIKDWTKVGPTTDGARNMGAAFNFKFIAAEEGAHVHNRTFAKRLITDAIQYLQDGYNTYSYSASATGPNVGGQADPNDIIDFSGYAAYRPNFTYNGISVDIATLQQQLLRLRGGLYYRR